MATKGENRVGLSFNPSGNDQVDRIKRAAADLIDLIEEIAPAEGGDLHRAMALHLAEVARCKALAQTAIEEAAMWAVKAATKPAPL